jgi:hypothetical protein
MSNRHRRTLAAIFRDPVSATIIWDDVERMLVHYGAKIFERSGSRILVVLGDEKVSLHRPHPRKEALPYVIRGLRQFLTLSGVTPWE